MRLASRFRSVNSKIGLIISAAVLVVIALYFVDLLYIPILVTLLAACVISASIVSESHRREAGVANITDLSSDEKWSRLKMDLERTNQKLRKATDEPSRKVLNYQKRWLEAELRKLQWTIQESDLTTMYNAARRGGLREAKPRLPSKAGSETNSSNDNEKSQDELDRRNLEKILHDAESVLKEEPCSSLSSALVPVSNDFRAHYNAIKRRSRNSSSLSDYWVSWAVILSVESSVPVDSSMAKYASSEFRPRIAKFLKVVESMNLPARQSDSAGERFEMGDAIEL